MNNWRNILLTFRTRDGKWFSIHYKTISMPPSKYDTDTVYSPLPKPHLTPWMQFDSYFTVDLDQKKIVKDMMGVHEVKDRNVWDSMTEEQKRLIDFPYFSGDLVELIDQKIFSTVEFGSSTRTIYGRLLLDFIKGDSPVPTSEIQSSLILGGASV